MVPPPPARRAAASSHTNDAWTYTLAAVMCCAGINLITGTHAIAYCTAWGALFLLVASLARTGGPRAYGPRNRATLAVALRTLFAGAHSACFALSDGRRHDLPPAVAWPHFWLTRHGQSMLLFLNLSTNAAVGGRGPRLAASLVAQAVLVAVTTPAGCRGSLSTYPVLRFFYGRLEDLWSAGARAALAATLGAGVADGSGGRAPSASPLPEPLAAACGQHACVKVTDGLYLAVLALTWAAAPPGAAPAHAQRRRPPRRPWPVALLHAATGGLGAAATFGTLAWLGLGAALPRPEGCVGSAAASAAHWLGDVGSVQTLSRP